MPHHPSDLWANIEHLDPYDDGGTSIAQFDVAASRFQSDEDFGVIAAQYLDEWETAHTAAGHHLDPGRYRFSVHDQYTGQQIGAFVLPLPAPAAWKNLNHDDRRFAVRQMRTTYRGVPAKTIAEHLAAFRDHVNGHISDTDLAHRTGFQVRP